MSFLARTLTALLMIALVTACGITKGRDAALKSIDTFHEQLNDSKFAEIYSGADDGLRKAAKEPEFMKFIEAVHRKLGAYKSGKQSGWNTNVTTSGTYIKVSYSSEFEKGSAVETFDFILSDETAKLLGYHINSNALLTE